MDQRKLTPWREFFKSDHFSAWDLEEGEERVLTIASVGREQVMNPGTSKKESCLVIGFKEKQKPMVLNATNCKTIHQITGEKHVENWIGRRIQVYQSVTKLRGEEVLCLRIRPAEPPATKPELTPEHEKWQGAINSIAAGTNNLDGVRKYFAVSPGNAALLQAEADRVRQQQSEDEHA